MTREEVSKKIDAHFRANYSTLVKIFSRYTGAKDKAEDVVQEGYMRALQYWQSFPDGEEEDQNRYLRRIMNNVNHSQMREEQLHGMSKVQMEEPVINCSGYAHMILEQIKDCIMEKSPLHSRILYLISFDQYRPGDVAEATGETENNIRQVAFRFREEIKKRFNWSI